MHKDRIVIDVVVSISVRYNVHCRVETINIFAEGFAFLKLHKDRIVLDVVVSISVRYNTSCKC